MADVIKCPKCGVNMIHLPVEKIWYCLLDGTEIPEAEAVDMVRADDPVLNGWRDYL